MQRFANSFSGLRQSLSPAITFRAPRRSIVTPSQLVANDYAIVMGSSHAEPMLRNNVGEWNVATRGPWDYDKNRDGILKYWEERLRRMAATKTLTPSGCAASTTVNVPAGRRDRRTRSPACSASLTISARCWPAISIQTSSRHRRYSSPTQREIAHPLSKRPQDPTRCHSRLPYW